MIRIRYISMSGVQKLISYPNRQSKSIIYHYRKYWYTLHRSSITFRVNVRLPSFLWFTRFAWDHQIKVPPWAAAIPASLTGQLAQLVHCIKDHALSLLHPDRALKSAFWCPKPDPVKFEVFVCQYETSLHNYGSRHRLIVLLCPGNTCNQPVLYAMKLCCVLTVHRVYSGRAINVDLLLVHRL